MQTKTSSLSIQTITKVALLTAVICILGPISLPIGPVPISLTNFATLLAVYLLGTWGGTLSLCIYLLLGLVGLPIFSGFTGGPAKLLGPTGGYLFGFIPMAIIAGLVIDYTNQKLLPSILAMIVGTLICYIFGSLWLAYQMSLSFKAALAVGVLPFIPLDLVKIVVVAIIGLTIRKRLPF
ncbi:Substrate-specific component BioY of biotin ECF transporter [Lachnospiraceae bacterium TWA4]|nr:Substrate-specific component BioY of biotin ECF transporter [Lachnospiraceae bacterium TWA4]